MSLKKIKKGINNNFKNEVIPIPELPQNFRQEFLQFFTSEDLEWGESTLVLINLKFIMC